MLIMLITPINIGMEWTYARSLDSLKQLRNNDNFIFSNLKIINLLCFFLAKFNIAHMFTNIVLYLFLNKIIN